VLTASRHPVVRASALAAALALLLLLVPAAARAATDQGRLSPIVVAPIPQAAIVPVQGSDNRWHVMYELQLTNTLAGPADLLGVTVVDADRGRPLLRLNADQLIAGEYLHTLTRTTAETTRFEGNQARILILNLSFRSRRSVPERITQRFDVEGSEPFNEPPTDIEGETPASPTPINFRYAGGQVRTSRHSVPVLTPPLRGREWLSSNAPPGPTSHVNAIVGLDGKPQAAERWAADWIRIDPSGRVYTGDRTNPENWFGYNVPIHAAADGVVTATHDGMPNQVPGTPAMGLTFAQLPGNYVAERIRGGFTAVYAHLVPGSVAVKVGQRLRTGQRVGRLGNTGGSLAPHLHFHIVNGSDVAASDGFPFVFNSFALAGQTDIAALGPGLQGEAAFPTEAELNPKPHTDELPLDFNIIDFPGR
jgi:hypothetical protein